MRLFLAQLIWEFRKLGAQPRTYLAPVAGVLLQMTIALLLRVPSIRTAIVHDLWRIRFPSDDALSGLSIAAQLMGNAGMMIGWPFLALVAGGIVAGEVDAGTMRSVLARPVTRGRIFWQKLIVCGAYTLALCAFFGMTALIFGLSSAPSGRLAVAAIHDGVLGVFDFPSGLQRYLLAVALLAVSSLSIVALAFAFSCCPVKPAIATAAALALFLADDVLRHSSPHISPHCLSTRVQSWRQVFNDDIPWGKLRRNYRTLLGFNATALLGGWLVFRRRDFTL